jgi:hypothetical protein
VVAEDVLAARPAGVLPHEDDEQRLGQDEEEPGDAQDDVIQAVDVGRVRRDARRQPPAEERRDCPESQAGEHQDREQNAPAFLHELSPKAFQIADFRFQICRFGLSI